MISVVIPAYNEEKTILHSLHSLSRQQTKQKFEVIVVDNNSIDDTKKAALRFKSKLLLTVLTEKKKGRGAARAAGFAKAKGNIILSTDADVILPNNWIEKFTVQLEKKGVVAVTGPHKIIDRGIITNTLTNITLPLLMRIYRVMYGYFWLNGSSFGIYKDVYMKTGGFNKNLNAHEDVELSSRVKVLGKISFVNTKIICSGRRFHKGFIRGFTTYLLTFISYFFFKNEEIILTDIR